ncbi:F-box protein CPR1 [Trifolium repens]|nr:F-box protein CPR1 [Trifolium repens]
MGSCFSKSKNHAAANDRDREASLPLPPPSPSNLSYPLSLPYVPNDIASRIFCHCPVQSVIRFQSISKPISSMIDSREFVSAHLQNSSSLSTISTSPHVLSIESSYPSELS